MARLDFPLDTKFVTPLQPEDATAYLLTQGFELPDDTYFAPVPGAAPLRDLWVQQLGRAPRGAGAAAHSDSATEEAAPVVNDSPYAAWVQACKERDQLIASAHAAYIKAQHEASIQIATLKAQVAELKQAWTVERSIPKPPQPTSKRS